MDNLAACERTGACMWGCPKGAKSSTDTTMWPQALANGAKLVTGARVRKITTNGNGLATGAIYVDRDGQEQRQEADVVIVAGNGVGTARLLLLSDGDEGLANSSGLVGKRLMLHPYMSVLGIYEDDLEGWLGPWGTQLLSLEFADHDESRGFPLGAQWDVMPLGGPPLQPLPLRRASIRRALGRPGPRPDGVDARARVRLSGIENLPHESNTVTLDRDLTDSTGFLAPKITFTIDDDMRANLEFQLARAREAHEAAGAAKTIVADWSQWAGTCSGRRGWATIRRRRSSTAGAPPTTSRTSTSRTAPSSTSGPMASTSTICANSLRCA